MIKIGMKTIKIGIKTIKITIFFQKWSFNSIFGQHQTTDLLIYKKVWSTCSDTILTGLKKFLKNCYFQV